MDSPICDIVSESAHCRFLSFLAFIGAGEAEKCFTVLDSDDFGQKEEVGSPVADLLSPGGQFLSPASHQGSSGSERKLASIDPDCQQTAQPEKEVIPPGNLELRCCCC